MEHNPPTWSTHLHSVLYVIVFHPQGNLFKLISVLPSEFRMKMYLFSGSYNNGSVQIYIQGKFTFFSLFPSTRYHSLIFIVIHERTHDMFG